MANVVRMAVDAIEPGSKLADVVLNESGTVLLEKGTVLTAALLRRMQEWGITSAMIMQGAVEIAPMQNFSTPPANWSTVMTTPKEFADQYAEAVQGIRHVFDVARNKDVLPLSDVYALARSSLPDMLNAVGVINHLQLEREVSDYTFHHSVNVAVIAGLLGKWLAFSDSDIADLIVAGLLHDIGKSRIPAAILDKPGELTREEMAVMQQHAYFGYQLVKKEKSLSPNIVYAVLQHHERMDGSGYPLRVKGEAIHVFGRIVAIADIYDAMTSNRVYREKVAPFTVVETLVSDMYQKLDVEICTAFLNNVRDCFLGNIVLLNNGQQAEVIYLGQFMAARPVVRTDKGEFIDLERRKDLAIVKLMSK